MKSLKQTTLSFTPVPKNTDASSRSRQHSTASSIVSSSKSEKSGYFIDCVEIPRPAERIARTKSAAKASSSKSKHPPARRIAYTERRKPNLKRKSSPDSQSDIPHTKKVVHVPRITVDQASSPAVAPVVVSIDRKAQIPSPLKKRRLSSPLSNLTPLASSLPASSVHETDIDDVEFVPTSQSNERELTLPSTAENDTREVQESVDRWRQKMLPILPSQSGFASEYERSCSPLSDVPMDVDFDPFTATDLVPETPVIEARREGLGLQYPQTPSSIKGEGVCQVDLSSTMATPASRPDKQRSKVPYSDTSPSDAFRSLTPPPSSDIDHEPEMEEAPVVQPLDTKSKTEKLIADIKARARAAAQSSPEQSPIDFDAFSESDSSTDEDDMPGGLVAALVKDSKGRSGTRTTDTYGNAGPSEPAPEAISRYNLRRSSPSRPKEKAVTPVTRLRKPRKSDPVGFLLREKQREERTRTGMAAVRLAEETIARAKADLHEEVRDEEDGFDSDYDHDHHVPTVPGARHKGKLRSPVAGPSSRRRERMHDKDGDNENAVIAQINCRAILGEGADAVERILAKDMKENMAQALAKEKEAPLGITFWSFGPEDGFESDEGMDAVFPLPPFTAEVGGNAVRQLLKNATKLNDISQISALLTSGFVAFLGVEQFPVLVPWLFYLVFSDGNASITTLAYIQLLRLGPLVGPQVSGLRLSTILTALVRLGVSSSVLTDHGWAEVAAAVSVSNKAVNCQWRSEMTHRIVSLVDAFAQSFARDELSDLSLVLLLIAMDPTTSESLRTEIRKACDSLSLAMTLSHEFATCTKVVAFGRSLSPPNQSLLISLIPCTSPPTVRMARCISRALLLDVEPSAVEFGEGLPDLRALVDLLSPPSGSGGYFDIAGNAEKEGYFDNFTCRLSLLSRALTDIDEYTIVEKRMADEAAKKRAIEQATRKTDAGKSREQGEDEEEKKTGKEPLKRTMLEQVKIALDELHGKIIDTRAAHLDRSRAKAALQRLALRVHYQRVATLQSRQGMARPRNLLSYFHGAFS